VRPGELPRVIRLAFAAVAALCVASSAAAAYPEKPIRFVIPSVAGGSPDVLMRILAQQLSVQLGVPIVIENKPGASYVIGTMEIVRAPPDGYTLGYGNIVSLAINRSLLASVPYDIERDLTLVSNCVRVFNLLAVNKNLPVSSVQELIDYARKNPGKLVMASGGNGTTGHLGGELFKTMTGTFMLHVPYRGSPQAINDVMAGEANLIFDNLSSITPHVKAGRVRGLGVSGPRRSPVFPDLPAIGEIVPGYETVAWGGVIGPANLPKDVVARLNAELKKALRSPAVQERYRQLDTETDGGSPEEFLALAKRETVKWAEVVKRAGAKVD
jgi:tripartite-type tricarboxylate transporter receptor subunit TctC